MRSGLIGLLAVGGLALSLFLGWNWLASLPASATEEQPWQVRELLFLKAAYDRMQDDLARNLEGSDSLRAEQRRIVQQMAETAKLVPPDTVPAEISSLLARAAQPPQIEHAALSRLIESVVVEEKTPDLRAGLGSSLGASAPPAVDLGEFAIDPELREPIRPPPARRKRVADAAPKKR